MYILKAGEGCVLKMRLVEANGAPIELRNARFVQAILHLPNEATMLCEDVRFDEVSQLVFVRLSAKSELTMEGVYGININALFDGRRIVTSAVLDFAEVKANAESRYYELLIDLIVSTTDVPSCVKYTGASPKISENGTWLVFNDEINAFENTGISIFGKSAYQAAIESGNFSGTEEEFNAYMGSIPQITNDAILATTAANEATTNANNAGAEAVRIATTAANGATTAKENAERATEQANNATENANKAAQRANDVIDNLETGSYPEMTVGKAENLVGRGEATEEFINFRQSAGKVSIEDGSAKITKIKGNSLVWKNIADITKPLVNDGYIFNSVEGGGFTIERNPSIASGYWSALNLASTTRDTSHKYLFIVDFEASQISTGSDNVEVNVFALESPKSLVVKENKKERFAVISKPHSSQNGWQFAFYARGNAKLTVFRLLCVDLTKEFGAGNEPTTIEEFYARKPIGVDIFAYNAGEIVSMSADSLVSIGENAFDYRKGYGKVLGGKTYNFEGTYTSLKFATTHDGTRETITLNENKQYTFEQEGYVFAEGSDICINIKHSYDKEFMHDYQQSMVDLSFIKSIKDSDGNELFLNGLASIPPLRDGNGNIIAGTEVYDEIRYNATTKKWEAVKRIGVRAYVEGDVENSAVLTDGVNTNYELEDTIIEELDIDFNPTYLVWDFGTEEALASVPSAPFRADIIYQFNAVDRIRNNSDRIAVLEAKIASLVQTMNAIQTTNLEE